MPQGNSNYPRRPAPKYSTWPAGDPRRRLIRSTYGSSAVQQLPIVSTVGVNAISATSANVIGSVNPNGLSTTWWVSYGTSLPLPSGTVTAPAGAGSGTTPVTNTSVLTGLTQGLTYYIAVVGQSSAGTVYGQTFSFLAQPTVVTTATPVVPFGQPSVTIPHFQFPVTLGAVGGIPVGLTVVEQDTLEEVVSNVGVIVSCTRGACTQLPNFGRPDVLFSQEPINAAGIEQAIQQWEPRATEDVVGQFLPNESGWRMILQTSTSAAQNI